jgi:putative holliday junction resolvase
MGRILALDFGTIRIGAALSDPLKIIAQPFGTWSRLSSAAAIERVADVVREQGVETVIVGHPLTLRGTASRFTGTVERFSDALSQKIPVPVRLWDERLSSVQAQRELHRMGRRPSRDKAAVDALAAVLILQHYLDTLNEKARRP